MQIPSGVLSERFGPRRMIFVGMFLVSVLTILTPVLARGSPYLLIVTRVLIGMGEVRLQCKEISSFLSLSINFFLEINLYSRLQCIQEHKSFGPNGHPRMKGVGLLRLLLGVSALK